jgi:hypothetical protein
VGRAGGRARYFFSLPPFSSLLLLAFLRALLRDGGK